jgi:hypothetical protein
MKCPRCVQRVTPEGASCPHCGYSLQAARALYGAEAVLVERLMDVESLMTPEDQASVMAALLEFEQLFPQLFFLMFLGPLPPPASPRQFAFWLLNHAAVADADAFRPNERGLLLVVDPKAGAAALSGGYVIEHLLSVEDLERVLRAASRDLGRGDYPAALRNLLAGLVPLLRRRAKEAAKRPIPRPVWLAPDGFPPLQRTGEAVVVYSETESAEGEAGQVCPAAVAPVAPVAPVDGPVPAATVTEAVENRPMENQPVKSASGAASKRSKIRRP